MASITRHSKERIIERIEDTSSFSEAKRLAKTAKRIGRSINSFQQYPKLFAYLQNKRDQSNTCTVKVYQGYIYIWRGKKQSLVTMHPIPDRYLREMEIN